MLDAEAQEILTKRRRNVKSFLSAPPRLRVKKPLLLFGLVALAGWLTNFWRAGAIYLLVTLCLLLPLLAGERMALRRALHWPQEGWLPALALSGLALAGPVALLAMARLASGAAFHTLPAAEAGAWLLQRLALLLPLALAEEFFFRGYLQEGVGRRLWGKAQVRLGAVPISRKNAFAALLFGLAHVLAQASPVAGGTVLSGLVLGALVEHSRGSIWPPVLLHTGLNLAVAVGWLLLGLNYPLLQSWLLA